MSTNKLHNPDGPALKKYYDLIDEVRPKCFIYYSYGKEHREDGPAVIEWDLDGNIINEEYWLNGKQLDELQVMVLKGDEYKNE